MLKPDLTISEVVPNDPRYPKDQRCKSGHVVDRGVRFFLISGKTLPRDRWGVYCENCLAAAHQLNQQRKAEYGN